MGVASFEETAFDKQGNRIHSLSRAETRRKGDALGVC